MKWIKTREAFLNEAKIKSVIHPRQAEEIARVWGEKYLEYEEVNPTDKIKQGKWLLSKEDKMKVLSKFFSPSGDECDMNNIFSVFDEMDEKFAGVLEKSVDTNLLRDEKYKFLMKDFTAKKPTIDQLTIFFDPIFRKLSINETRATSYIQKDENGRPIRDEEGNMLRVEKQAGDPVFEKNLVNITSFIESYNSCYPDDKYDVEKFKSQDFKSMINLSKENHNREFKMDFEIFEKDIYLSINHKAQDILNMSISKFYASCQHLYSGSYREQLLGNVFDPNSIPAFFVFDTPIFWENKKISDNLPLARMMVRNIESFDKDSESKIFFDRTYPDRMKEIMDEMVEKYSGNIATLDDAYGKSYLFTPDIDIADEEKIKHRTPYMDRFSGVEFLPMIGKNTKSIYLSRNYDWSKVRISPDAKIKEVVIETDVLPENLNKINLEPEWLKFKFMKINSLEYFDTIKTPALAFEKCQLGNDIVQQANKINPNLEKLQLTSCDLTDEIDLSEFKNLKELQVIFTLDDIVQLRSLLETWNDSIADKKLVVSGDLFTDAEDKEFLNSLRSKRIKVETVGPMIMQKKIK